MFIVFVGYGDRRKRRTKPLVACNKKWAVYAHILTCLMKLTIMSMYGTSTLPRTAIRYETKQNMIDPSRALRCVNFEATVSMFLVSGILPFHSFVWTFCVIGL